MTELETQFLDLMRSTHCANEEKLALVDDIKARNTIFTLKMSRMQFEALAKFVQGDQTMEGDEIVEMISDAYVDCDLSKAKILDFTC